MRHRAVLISVAAHGVAVAAIAGITIHHELRIEIPLETIPPSVELVAPIDIAIVELPDLGGDEAGSSDPAVASRSRIASGSRSTRGEAPSDRGPRDTSPDTPSGWFQMRGLRHDLSIPTAILDRIRMEPILPPEIPTPHDERMKAKGGGTYKIYDRVTKVTIDKDGSAHFKDKPYVSIGLGKPFRWITKLSIKKLGKDLGDAIDEWYEDPYRQTHAGPSSGMSNVANAVPGGCGAWDAPGCDSDRPQSNRKHDDEGEDDDDSGGSLLGGRLAIDDWLHRKYVGDPYASRKLKLLDSTRDERAKIGAAHRSEQLYRSGELVTRNLEAAWRSTADPVARKAALFALWDDCAEDAESALGEAGHTARGVVLGWINAKLPKGSPAAFTDQEIAKFDAHRTSKQHFAPYAQAPSPEPAPETSE